MNSAPMIMVEGLSVTRRARPVLKDICLQVEPGERLALVGPNGAGKTTLLKCLNRILTGWSGRIRLAGQDLDTYSQRDLAQRMAYVPQTGPHQTPFTVEVFVSMGRYAYQGPLARANGRDRQAVEDALALTDTAVLRDRMLGHLSGGETQRVMLAAALAQESQVLLLDEPTVFLDPRHEAAFHRVLTRVHRERQLTLITVTHDLNRAVLMHDTLMALRQGQVVYHGSPNAFMAPDILNSVYENAFLLTTHPITGSPVVLPEVPI